MSAAVSQQCSLQRKQSKCKVVSLLVTHRLPSKATDCFSTNNRGDNRPFIVSTALRTDRKTEGIATAAQGKLQPIQAISWQSYAQIVFYWSKLPTMLISSVSVSYSNTMCFSASLITFLDVCRLLEICSQDTCECRKTRQHHDGRAVLSFGMLECACNHSTPVG